MPKTRAVFSVLLLYALLGTLARGEDTHQPPAEDPDAGFLEFLGSVDGLAEANPDYLAQSSPGRPAPPDGVPARPAPPPPPPPPPPRAAGVKNNE